MSLKTKEHTGGARTGPLELFCSPHHTTLACLIPSLSGCRQPCKVCSRGSLAAWKQAELCKREACITGALITNWWAVSSRLILLPCEEAINHIKEEKQCPALQNKLCSSLLPLASPHTVLTTWFSSSSEPAKPLPLFWQWEQTDSWE